MLLAQSSTTVIIVICMSCMYGCNLYRRPHPMQWRRPLMKSPNFWVSSAEYYIGLLSLGRGHNIARLDTRAPGFLRHAARLKTSCWPGQWLHYLAAVVSICEYTVSGLAVSLSWLRTIVHTLYLRGQLPQLSPQIRPPMKWTNKQKTPSVELSHIKHPILHDMACLNVIWQGSAVIWHTKAHHV